MAPETKMEFVVVELKLMPQWECHPPVYKRRKMESTDDYLPHIAEWIIRVFRKELAHVPNHLEVSYREWMILTGDADLFIIQRYRFDNVLMVVGEQRISWMFYNNVSGKPHFKGYSRLVNNFCGCCVQAQYLSILKNIKISANKRIQ